MLSGTDSPRLHVFRNSLTSFNLYFGRAADIYAMNGVNVSSLNFHARQVALFLNQLPDQLHPSEVGSPFYDIVYPGAFADSDHWDHVHIGFD